MRAPLRRSRAVPLLALLGVCFVVSLFSFFLLASVPADFSPPLRTSSDPRKFIRSENSIVRKAATEGLKSIEQEIGEGLKVPADIILRDSNYHEPVIDIGNFNNSGLRDDGAGQEVHGESEAATTDRREQMNQLSVGKQNGSSRHRPMVSEKVSEMEDQLIMAKTYLQFAPANINSHLVRELKLRIKDIERILGHARGSNISKGALQKMKSMEDTLSKASKAYPDCSAMTSKLRAMTQNREEQLRTQRNQALYLTRVAASTFPKGLHCLSMWLTTQYFTLEPQKRQLPNRNEVQNEDLYHYAIFSDNTLATAVVVNSTISSSRAPDKVVFHVVTDNLNFPAMTMWFLTNPPGQATIQIQSMDDFKWLPPNLSSMIKQSGVRDPRLISPLNHLRFYLPEIFPYLNKVVLLDHDVVVQKDLSDLWKIDMKGKVIGVVETCKEDNSSQRLDMLVDFSEPTIAKNFDAKACLWAFGMNVFDLHEWRRRGLTRVYNKWLQLGRRRQSWKAGSSPLGQLTFYNHTLALDRRWHLVGLGQDSLIGKTEIERAAVIHYNGNMKPWLEIGVPRFRGYWNKFIKFDQPALQQCNIHE